MIGSRSYVVYGGDSSENYGNKEDAISRAEQLAGFDWTNIVWVEETVIIWANNKSVKEVNGK